MPLSLEQFLELIAAADKYDSYRKRDLDRFGIEVKAIFLVQRWVGQRELEGANFDSKAARLTSEYLVIASAPRRDRELRVTVCGLLARARVPQCAGRSSRELWPGPLARASRCRSAHTETPCPIKETGGVFSIDFSLAAVRCKPWRSPAKTADAGADTVPSFYTPHHAIGTCSTPPSPTVRCIRNRCRARLRRCLSRGVRRPLRLLRAGLRRWRKEPRLCMSTVRCRRVQSR
jgi:hypothetical protein